MKFCCNKKESDIIQKALELFNTYGIKSVSMDDISRELGISKKTLYRFVKDKEELVEKSIIYNFKSNEKKIENLIKPSYNAIEELLAIVRFFIEMHQSHSPNMIFDLQKFYPEVFKSFCEVKQKKLNVFYENNFKNGMNEGLYRKDLDVSIVKRIIIFLSNIIIDNDIFTIKEVTSARFIKELYSYHLHGIVSEKGLKLLEKELSTI